MHEGSNQVNLAVTSKVHALCVLCVLGKLGQAPQCNRQTFVAWRRQPCPCWLATVRGAHT